MVADVCLIQGFYRVFGHLRIENTVVAGIGLTRLDRHEMKSKCRLLLVDDYAPLRAALHNLLHHFDNIEVIGEATNGREAVQRAASCQPDVILMDMNMPTLRLPVK